MSEAEEKNKALVRKFLEETWGKGNLAAVDEFMAPNYVEHGLPRGTESLKQTITTYHTAFPDLKATLHDIFAEGDRVTCRWSTRGTHLGYWLGIPPTGNHFTITGISIYRIAGEKVVENWTTIDISRTEEEQQWLFEDGRTSGAYSEVSGNIPLAGVRPERSVTNEALIRNLTWRFREAEARERERIEQELRVAHQIQQALLPEAVPKQAGWQLAPFYQPAREVGGDFYDFFELPNGHLGLVVGDATDKGMPAALMMSTTCGMLRAVALSVDSPGGVLERVNEALSARIPPNMFVTCFYAILDPGSASLRYANAGHDLPYLRHSDGECEELKARGMPLGLMPDMSYEEKEIVLDPGEAVLFYSDGLVEAHDPKGEMFGFPRLRALVAEHGREGSLGDSLLKELYSFVGDGWQQEDDITLLTLRRSPFLS